jgi:hypothetical protein
MAKEIGYMENFVPGTDRYREVFSEGPFVICNPMDNGWRIEEENENGKCPCLPDTSIYNLMKRIGPHGSGKWLVRDHAERTCDFLNSMVKCGQIRKLSNGAMIWHK